MTRIATEKQAGISPKVQNPLLVGLAFFLVSKLGLQWDPIVEQAVNALLMILTGFLSSPGDVCTTLPGNLNVDPAAGDVRPPKGA